MTEQKEPMTHVFFKPCGCLACAIVDKPEMYPELGRAYRYAEKHGETYKKMETQEVRTMEWKCPEHKAEKKPEKVNNSKQPSLL
jgi:hypothetical protein